MPRRRREDPHFCAAEGCTANIPREFTFCKWHWYKLPPWLRAGLVAARGERQQVTGHYLRVHLRARQYIAHKENHPSSPVLALQLADDLRSLLPPMQVQPHNGTLLWNFDVALGRVPRTAKSDTPSDQTG